mmetsp:Transcript_43225/g.108299  ORF Transcript_43225/g.108299 Transcript_43225/m.108299 type:complete len:405 (-) Transcript_43225:153-1367(-)
MRPRRSSRRLAVSPACVSNCVVLLGLTISTCMLLRLALKPRGGGASLADIERAEDLLEPVSDEDFLDGDKDFIKLAKKLPDFKATMKDARGKKWRARSARVQRNASMEYPQLEGLPIYISDDNRRVKKQDIFVTKSNYDKLMAGYRDEKDMLTKSGRPTEHFKNDWLIPKRSFPEAEAEDLLGGAALRSCAVVGSSGSLLNTSMGSAIDTHDFVMRINYMKVSTYEAHTGNRTHAQFLGHTVSRDLCCKAPIYRKWKPTAELDTIYTWYPANKEQIMRWLRRRIRSPDRIINKHSMSDEFIESATTVFKAFRGELLRLGFGPFQDWQFMTTGMHALLAMLRHCDNIDVYGFTASSRVDMRHNYHGANMKPAKREQLSDPMHSWDNERLVLRLLHATGAINLCST